MKHLPYRVTTATGAVVDIQFPLHAETVSAVTVSQLLDSVLRTLSREIAVLSNVGNGDVLQALAMALAVRTGIIHAPFELLAELAWTSGHTLGGRSRLRRAAEQSG